MGNRKRRFHRSDNSFSLYWVCLFLVLSGISLLATIRTLFIGLDVDEQYALTLIVRFAKGDIPVKEMWEPHQTSVIFPALFAKLFLLLSPGYDYLLIYLRFIGCMMQLGLCAFWCYALRDRFTGQVRWLTAFLIYNILPKWMTIPEFANQQLWFLVFTILCLYLYFKEERVLWILLGGIVLSLEVLAYPSCVLLFFVFFGILWKKNKRASFILLGVCSLCGGLFLGSLLCYMSAESLMTNIAYILNDPEHSQGLWDKLFAYGKEAFEVLLYLICYIALAGLGTAVVSRFRKEKRDWSFLCFLFVIPLLDQVRFWVMKEGANVHPQIQYLVAFLLCAVLYAKSRAEEWDILFRLCFLPSIVAFVSVLLFTNLDIKASLVHLLPGILCSFLFFLDKGECREWVRYSILVFWVIVLACGRIFLLRANEGMPQDVFCVKQKSLYGATKGVYCEYMLGYELNSDYQAMSGLMTSGERVFYMGANTAVYLLKDCEICSASTISTPIFNSRYLEYFESNPDKKPTLILIDKAYLEFYHESMVEVLDWVKREYDWDNKTETEFLYLVKQ